MMVGGAHVRSGWETGATLWQWRLLWNVESLLKCFLVFGPPIPHGRPLGQGLKAFVGGGIGGLFCLTGYGGCTWR